MRRSTLSISPLLLVLILSATAKQSSAQWTQTTGPGRAGVAAFIDLGSDLLAGTTTAGVYRTSDDGATWSPSNAGIATRSVTGFARNSSFTFCSVDFTTTQPGGVYRSSDAGRTWVAANAGIANQNVPSVYANDSFLLAGTIGAGIFKSTDNGTSWFLSNAGLGNQSIPAIVANGGVLYAAGDNNLYKSTDNGASWEFTDGVQYFAIFCLAADGSFMYGGGHGGIVRSTDGGSNWDGPIWIPILPDGLHITSFAVAGSVLYASTASVAAGFGVIKSTDHGMTWSTANAGIDITAVSALVTRGSRLLAGTPQKSILSSTDGGGHWNRGGAGLPPGGDVRWLLSRGPAVYAGTGGDGIYSSTNRGATWVQKSTEPTGRLQNAIVDAIADAGGALLATSSASGIFRSTDDGATWNAANTGLPLGPFFSTYALQALSGNVVVAGTSSGIFRSTDSGQSWQGTGITDYVPSFTAEPGFAYAIVYTGFSTSGVYRSTNAGVSWSLTFQSGVMSPIVLASGDGFLYLGDLLDGIARSSDHGVSWFAGNLQGGVFSILANGSTVYAGGQTDFGSMHVSTDHGASWSDLNAGLASDCSIDALAKDETYLYAGDAARAVWRLPLTPTAIAEASPVLRAVANEPNPFDRITSIAFDLPLPGPVRITIHDASGRVVDTPYERSMTAGPQRIDYDGGRLAPGVYFYRIESLGGTLRGKMTRVVH